MEGDSVSEGNGWTPDKRYVEEALVRIERDLKFLSEHIDRKHGELHSTIGHVREELAALKIKSGVWGLMGGMIPILITVIIYLTGHFRQ